MEEDDTWFPWEPPRYNVLPHRPPTQHASSSSSGVPVPASMDTPTIVPPPPPPPTLGSRMLQPGPPSIHPAPFVMNHLPPPAFPPLDYFAPIFRPVNMSPLLYNPRDCLYVAGVPVNCSIREIAHIFRHFRGYIRVRFAFRNNRIAGEDPIALCFVDFENSIYAADAMFALQGYRMDENDPESTYLNIRFGRLSAPVNWDP